MNSPRVSFLMAVHHNVKTVRAAIDSILQQTLTDLELILIDDAATDGTSEILRQLRDPRITLLTNPENLGLSRSLNRGLPLARGTCIARMDADDIALPQRAATQVAFLEAHPDIAVVGSAIETFSDGDSGNNTHIAYPQDPGTVAATLLFRSALAHPAVMWRRSALEGLQFNPAYRAAQDYALWIECLIRGLKLANLPDVLLRYRTHASQLSSQYAEGMQQEGSTIRARLLQHLIPDISHEQIALHNAISRNQLVADATFLQDVHAWLQKLTHLPQQNPSFHPQTLMPILTGRFVTLLRFAKHQGIATPNPQTSIFAPYLHPNALQP